MNKFKCYLIRCWNFKILLMHNKNYHLIKKIWIWKKKSFLHVFIVHNLYASVKNSARIDQFDKSEALFGLHEDFLSLSYSWKKKFQCFLRFLTLAPKRNDRWIVHSNYEINGWIQLEIIFNFNKNQRLYDLKTFFWIQYVI